MSTPAEIVRIPFHGTELLTVDEDGQPHIVFKPAIEALGLDFATQLTKLRRRSWACVGQRPMQLPGDTQSRTHTTVDVRTFLMLLATIDEGRVPGHVRPLLVAYQREVADVIEAYWTKGAAVRPGVEVGPQHEIPQTYAAALRLAADQFERAEAAERLAAQQNRELQAARPKVRLVETFIDPTEDATTFAVLAKQLGVPEAQLRQHLKTCKVIYRRVLGRRWSASKQREEVEYQWLPYSGYESWFLVKDQPDAPRLHNGQIRTTLYVSPVGKARIAELLTRKPISEVEPPTGGAA